MGGTPVLDLDQMMVLAENDYLSTAISCLSFVERTWSKYQNIVMRVLNQETADKRDIQYSSLTDDPLEDPEYPPQSNSNHHIPNKCENEDLRRLLTATISTEREELATFRASMKPVYGKIASVKSSFVECNSLHLQETVTPFS